MIGVVLACLAATELTVALLAGRGPGVVPTARHRLLGLGAGAVATVLVLLLAGATVPWEAVGGRPDVAPTLLAGGMALAVSSAWTAAGTRPWASPAVVSVLALLAGFEIWAYGGLHLALHSGWPVVLGALAFLVEPANRITRDVLVLAGRPSSQDVPPVEADRNAAPESAGATDDTPAGGDTSPDSGTVPGSETVPGGETGAEDPASGLRGGRWIGPVERLLMAGLGLAGAYPVVAALMAAKGIVRFPEISADAGRGSRAEEFLVGSLTSWGLAFLSGLLLAAVLHAPLLEVVLR